MIGPDTGNGTEFFGGGVGVFEKCTGYDLCSFVFGVVELFIIIIVQETDTRSEFMNGAADDRLIDQVAIKILLCSRIGS